MLCTALQVQPVSACDLIKDITVKLYLGRASSSQPHQLASSCYRDLWDVMHAARADSAQRMQSRAEPLDRDFSRLQLVSHVIKLAYTVVQHCTGAALTVFEYVDLMPLLCVFSLGVALLQPITMQAVELHKTCL